MLLPSKELLSEVLELDGIDRIDFERNSIFINYFYEINIHELVYKCKEWAISKGYYLYSVIVDKEAYAYITYPCDTSLRLFSCHSDTEPEAIFKACEYIMEQTK